MAGVIFFVLPGRSFVSPDSCLFLACMASSLSLTCSLSVKLEEKDGNKHERGTKMGEGGWLKKRERDGQKVVKMLMVETSQFMLDQVLARRRAGKKGSLSCFLLS